MLSQILKTILSFGEIALIPNEENTPAKNK